MRQETKHKQSGATSPQLSTLMVRTFLNVYMELGSYFLFLQEQIKDIIIRYTPIYTDIYTHTTAHSVTLTEQSQDRLAP